MVIIDVGAVRAAVDRLFDGKRRVRSDVAEGLVAESIWWLTHNSGHPVRAPKFGKRVEGGRLALGANTFRVAEAILKCVDAVLMILGKVELAPTAQTELETALVTAICSSVSSANGGTYRRYPVTDGEMVFGAQAISVEDFIKQFLRRIGMCRLAGATLLACRKNGLVLPRFRGHQPKPEMGW